MKKVGLALGGGGARGFCHIAFLEALDEMGIKPSIISGTSIGAIIGGFYAAGYSGAEIRAICDKIDIWDINKMLDFKLFGDAMFKGKGVNKFFKQYIKIKTFEELDIPLYVVATDFWHHEEVVFKSGELMPAIRASMSIPAIFEPVVFDNKVLVDGGAVNPLPYDIIRRECDVLIAVDVSGRPKIKKSKQMPSMFESVMGTLQIMQDSILKSKRRVSEIDVYVKPNIEGVGILEFFRYKEIMKGVENDVEKFKNDLTETLNRGPFAFLNKLKTGK